MFPNSRSEAAPITHAGSMRTKSSKRVNPLRAKEALRIEKPPRPKRGRYDLPSWYYRVHAFSYKGDRDVQPWDFDEDISDLEADKTQMWDGDKQLKDGEDEREDEADCECDGKEPPDCDCQFESEGEADCECDWEDLDCDCQFEGDDYERDEDDDVESERSYDGSDSDYYYELKKNARGTEAAATAGEVGVSKGGRASARI